MRFYTKRTLSGPNAKLWRISSRTLSHEPEHLHDNSQRDLWSSSAVPCVTNFPWLASHNRRLDGADVVKLDRSCRHRRLELLRNKHRHAWLTRRKHRVISKHALIGTIGMSALGQKRRHPAYSIIWSASPSICDGTVTPSSLAALRLTINVNLLGCSIGRAAGSVPLRILST